MKNSIHTIKFCMRILFQASKKYFSVLILIMAVSSLTPFAVLFFTSRLIQFLSENINNPHVQYQELLLLLAGLFLINVFNRILEYANTYMTGLLNELVDKESDQLLMNKAVCLDLSYFDSSAFYNELKDAMLNKHYVINTTFSMIHLAKSMIQLLIATVSLARVNWIFSILLAASIVPNVIFLQKQFNAVYDLQRKNLDPSRKKSYLSSLTYDKNFVKEIKVYDLGRFIIAKYQILWQNLYAQKKKTTFKYTVLLSFSSALPEIVTIGVFFLLCNYIFQGAMDLGNFTYYQGIANQVLASMMSVILIASQINDGSNRVRNFIKFLTWENDVNDKGTKKLRNPKKIEFKQVCFKYGDDLPNVLQDISFTIETDKLTAFAGNNGCGKSTLIKLLLRFYDPISGEILLDGINIKAYTIKSVREYFSIMFQDYGRYAFTIKESTGLSDVENMGNTERILEALDCGGAYAFLKDYSNFIDTYLTRQFDDEGVELSGGQWQSIALSRAFFREQAGMFIFDEPSSSLDAEAEAELFFRLEQLYRHKGAILISHRLSNIASADMIFVLDDGRMIEQGSHRELMQHNGKYAKMFRLQAEKYGVKDDQGRYN